MSGLSDYTPLTKAVLLSGDRSLHVRGLSLDDVAVLMNAHFADIDNIFNLYDQRAGQDQMIDAVLGFIATLVKESPALVGNIIALACDEPQFVDRARKLSASAQIEALKAVAQLTFEEAGGYRKFFESLSTLLRGAVPTLPKTDSPT